MTMISTAELAGNPADLITKVRLQIARWMTINDIDIDKATVQCANVFTSAARERGEQEHLCRLLGETITRIGAEWAAELAVQVALEDH